jgi:hypothetical protein
MGPGLPTVSVPSVLTSLRSELNYRHTRLLVRKTSPIEIREFGEAEGFPTIQPGLLAANR